MLVDREWSSESGPDEATTEVLRVTFRRKPTDEKGPVDGGIEITLVTSVDAADHDLALTLRALSEGAYVDKSFSQKLLAKSIIRDLPRVPKVSITSVLHSAMFDGG